MSPSEKTGPTLVDSSVDPFLASPENNNNNNNSSISSTSDNNNNNNNTATSSTNNSSLNNNNNSVASPSSAGPLSLASLESGSVIPASVMEYFPIKYQRQNKNDNTNPIPDNQSLQVLLKETLGGACSNRSLSTLLQLTEPLPPIIEGQGCEATSAPPASGCYDCSVSASAHSCCTGSYVPMATQPNSAPMSVASPFGYLSIPTNYDSPKFMKRVSMDHDIGSFVNFQQSSSHTKSLFAGAFSGVSPASLAHINPLASNGFHSGMIMRPSHNPSPNFFANLEGSMVMESEEDRCNDHHPSGADVMSSDCSECQHAAVEPSEPQNQLSIVPRNPDFLGQQLALPSNNLVPSTRSLMKKPSKKDDKEYIDLTTYLNMPQSEAARRLGIPTSSLSKKWKEAAFDRKWPYRTVCKIDKEITALLHNTTGPLPPDVEQTLGMLVRKRQEELRPVIIRK